MVQFNMVTGRRQDRPQQRRGWRHFIRRAGAGRQMVFLLAAGLAGCSSVPNYANPVEWYRDLTGISKNDDEGSQRNAENLAAGDKEPYPNLASVPPPPDRALSGADREKLKEGLVADRANAKYSDEELRAGRPVPEPPGAPPPAAENAAGTVAPAPSPAPPAGPRRSAAQSAQAPQESTLTSPTVRSVPAGDTPRSAPPAPRLSSPGAAAPATPPPPQAAIAPPNLPELTPAPAQSAAAAPGHSKRAAVSLNITQIAFAGGTTTLSPEDEPRVAEVAALYKKNGGRVRIVGYGLRGSGPDAAQQELTNFGQALDRANAVAQQLTKLGVPSSRIAVEAAPADTGGGLDADTAEIFLEY